jgi:ATP diphosphatase
MILLVVTACIVRPQEGWRSAGAKSRWQRHNARMNSDPPSPHPSRDIAMLLEIMAALRDPVTGCPWDVAQDFASIAPYTVEEAYEVADALARGDIIDLREELGDLLLQVVFHAQMASEAGAFDFGGVVDAITTKLIRRHPHVFGDKRDLSPDAVKALWGQIKAQEKAERAAARARAGQTPAAQRLLDTVPLAMPALAMAIRLQQRASTVGFDWNDPLAVLDKLREETDEVAEAIRSNDADHVSEEIGDLLFVVTNLARHLSVDPDKALLAANAKFRRRFAHVEDGITRAGLDGRSMPLDEMEALWLEAKRIEKSGPGDPPG